MRMIHLLTSRDFDGPSLCGGPLRGIPLVYWNGRRDDVCLACLAVADAQSLPRTAAGDMGQVLGELAGDEEGQG